MKPTEEAAYALDRGLDRSSLSLGGQIEYDRLVAIEEGYRTPLPTKEERKQAKRERRQKQRRRLDERQRTRLRNSGSAAVLYWITGTLVLLAGWVWAFVPGGFTFAVIAALAGICLYLGTEGWSRWPRMAAPLASAVLSKDRRAPILYLRPFAADRRAAWYERRIALSLKGLGPVVAIGQPGEELPATQHIPREYVAGDQWQEHVINLISRAQLVVIQIGISEGLTWELTQVVRLVRPDQLLVCPGPKVRAGADTELRYRQFREQLGPLFPKGLPNEPPEDAFIGFDPDWTPIPSRKLMHFYSLRKPSSDPIPRVSR